MTEVCLGVDPNVRRLGLALVAFEPPHEVLWADTVSIDRVDGGWTHEQVAGAMAQAWFHENGGPWRADPNVPHRMYREYRGVNHEREYEITRVGIEIPPHVNNTQTFRQLSVVFGLVGAECHRRWPWAPQVSCDVQQWKKGVLGKGNASKAEVMEWANNAVFYDPAGIIPLDHKLSQDSADAMAVATYAAGVELVERGAA